MRLAANLSMMFAEHPFLDRFSAAGKAGFTGVEYLFPYDFPADEIAGALRASGLTQALFNSPAGAFDKGERGLGALPGREREFREGVEVALTYATALDCKRIHCMAGIPPEDVATEAARATFIDNLRHACDLASAQGVTILIEPINQRDMPGYALSYQEDAARIIEEVGRPNLALQFDVYHCQIMQGDIIRRFERLQPLIAHIQIAGVPDRHEPDVGEIDPKGILSAIAKSGYDGWVGCEYRPAGETQAGLGWAKPWLKKG